MLNKEKAIRIEKQNRKSGGPRTIFIFKCSYDGCNKEIKCRTGKELQTRSSLCLSHSHTKKPFESIFNSFVSGNHRNIPMKLSYLDFLNFTKNKECHYCQSPISWTEFGVKNGIYVSRAYNLDRKNNNGPYSLENCVTCCTKCNKSKSNLYTYEEWYGMTAYFRNKA